MTTQAEFDRRDADKRKRLREFRQRMFLALAVTADNDGTNAEYAHEDQDELGLTDSERLEQTGIVFDTLLNLAGKVGKKYLEDASTRHSVNR